MLNYIPLVASVTLVFTILISCSDGGGNLAADKSDPLKYCQPTSAGALICDSKTCATVDCVDNQSATTFSVSVCTLGACQDSCPPLTHCLSFSTSDAYCVPDSTCR